MRSAGVFGLGCALLLAGSILAVVLIPAAQSAEKGGEPEPLSEAEAERLFLNYINDAEHLIRSCVFLGGVRISSVIQEGYSATARIQYRIQCTLEEFPTPPLSRSLREDFIYQRRDGHWILRGRAVELSPSQREQGEPVSSPNAQESESPVARERRILAEQVLSWAALGTRPSGVDDPFPGGEALRSTPVLLVSGENLDGVGGISVGPLEVHLAPPRDLLRRTTLAGEGVWVRFGVIEIQQNLAHLEVSLVAPILPPPPPGELATRTLVRVRVDFAREGRGWVLTRYQPR